MAKLKFAIIYEAKSSMGVLVDSVALLKFHI